MCISSDGPPAKCRKRDKGKLDENLLVSPLVVDSKLKTSITNAVNKHAAASALTNCNTASGAAGHQSSAADAAAASMLLSMSELKQEPGKGVASQGTGLPPTPTCLLDSAQYPPPSPITHSPASMRSTPGGAGRAGDVPEGLGSQFAGKAEFGRNHGFSSGGGGVRMAMGGLNPNHIDPRHFAAGAVQCNVLSQEDLKQSYFMQQQSVQQQPPPQQLRPGPHPQGAGMSFLSPAHPPFGAQGQRPVNHLGLHSQFPLGFPHNPHQHPQAQQAPGYSQHGYSNSMVYPMNMSQPSGHPGHPHHPPQNLLHHHPQQPQPHPMFQNLRMNSQLMWQPQHPPPPPHHGPAPTTGFPPELQGGGGMYPGMFSQAEPMWLETGKPKSKRPRSKKDKQKLNSIVDRTSPCDGGVKVKSAAGGVSVSPVVSKCVIPSSLSLASTTTSTVFPPADSALPCSVSFLENPAVFVAQQTAIINNSLASCNIDLNSPTSVPNIVSAGPKPSPHGSSAVPLIKVEQDCGQLAPVASIKLSEVQCKQEPGAELSPIQSEQDKLSPTPRHHFAESSAAKVGCGCRVSSANHNNNTLIVHKTECDQLSPKVLSCSASGVCGCRGGSATPQPSPQAKKKVSPKAKTRTKAVSAASKVNSINPSCLPECVSPAAFPQHSSLAQPVVHHVADPCVAGTVIGTAPMQIPDMSQVLVGGGNNSLNLLTLQQVLAQYSMAGGNTSGSLGMGENSNTAPDFPASSLLTAAARAQLSQQTPLGSFLVPAILQANGMTGQDVSFVATAAMQQQLQQQQLQQQQLQQQQLQQQQQQQVDPAAVPVNSNGELSAKTAMAMMAAGLVSMNPVAVSNLNQTGTLPLQLIPSGNVMTAGIVPAAQFQNGAVLTSGVPGLPAMQGLPFNVLLPVNQQLVSLGAEPVQAISVDLSGNLMANVSIGANVSKAFNISPKVLTNIVDSVATVSTGGQVLAPSQSSFSPQMATTTMKATGSTIHHLPQHSISNNPSHGVHVAQNIGHSINQSFPQNLSQVQNIMPAVGPSLGPSQGLAQNMTHTLAQQLGQSVVPPPPADSVSVSCGDAVMLNSLLPSILAFNAPMPPISLPMVTNVTNSLTQVVPAVGNTPALVAQQQQQQATAQFLNALALPAVAATAFTNPLLVTNPLAPPAPQFPTKTAADLAPDEKAHDAPAVEGEAEQQQADEGKYVVAESLQGGKSEEAELGVEKDQEQNPLQPFPVTGDAQQQQQQQHQVLVLPGGAVPLMQVLSNPGPLDKLCNPTPVFVPTAPQSAAVPDLAPLGTVALTPLGIQQMWNSLNSLQLQQLQTLQLQQLVWQQLQGCIPHQVGAVYVSCWSSLAINSVLQLFHRNVSCLLTVHYPSRQIRSASDTRTFRTSLTKIKTFCEQAFSFTSPRLELITFKKALKADLFKCAYD